MPAVPASPSIAPLHRRRAAQWQSRLQRVATRALPVVIRRSRPALLLTTALASISEGHVVDLVRLLEEATLPVWIAGGWGVDALVGRRTRRHDDLDLLVSEEDLPRVLDALAEVGYRAVWSTVVEGALLPARTMLTDARGRQVDLHPVALQTWLHAVVAARLPDAEDPATAAFAEGKLRATRLPCLSAALQLAAHEGYAARDVDRRDVALLRDAVAS